MARTKCVCRCSTARRITKRLYRDRTLSGLICTCLLYDFANSKNKSNNSTLESEFMQTQTNDAGERINPQTCQLIVAEFRKWMAVISNLVLQANSIKGRYKTYSVINNERMYITTLDMPMYVERFLKHLMVNHHNHYKNLCQSLAGGYIARNGYTDLNYFNKYKDKVKMYSLKNLNQSVY